MTEYCEYCDEPHPTELCSQIERIRVLRRIGRAWIKWPGIFDGRKNLGTFLVNAIWNHADESLTATSDTNLAGACEAYLKTGVP
jgi:hypothetical protein